MKLSPSWVRSVPSPVLLVSNRMDEVGYVTVAYADEYVNKHFLYTDPESEGWLSLGEEDKSVLLLRSFEAIDMLPFSGRTMHVGQTKAFPRFPYDIIPDAIKAAQVENAVALLDTQASDDSKFYESLRRNGVKSYSIGSLSESIGDISGSAAYQTGVVSPKAARLLQPYLGGGYTIRRARV